MTNAAPARQMLFSLFGRQPRPEAKTHLVHVRPDGSEFIIVKKRGEYFVAPDVSTSSLAGVEDYVYSVGGKVVRRRRA